MLYGLYGRIIKKNKKDKYILPNDGKINQDQNIGDEFSHRRILLEKAKMTVFSYNALHSHDDFLDYAQRQREYYDFQPYFSEAYFDIVEHNRMEKSKYNYRSRDSKVWQAFQKEIARLEKEWNPDS